MNTFKINLHKLSKDLKALDKNFSKTESLAEISGVSRSTVMSWENCAPNEVELIYWNAKAFNHSFFEMIDKKDDSFPAFKLLKYYQEKTGNPIENIIIKE